MHHAPEVNSRYQPVHAPTDATWLPEVYLVYRRWLHVSLGRLKPRWPRPEVSFEISLEFPDLEIRDEPLALVEF